MPKKPAKYGIKIYALVSSSKFYSSNLEVYVGTYKINKYSKDLVFRLVEPIADSNRNITDDNWFVSLDKATTLLYSLTFIAAKAGDGRAVPRDE